MKRSCEVSIKLHLLFYFYNRDGTVLFYFEFDFEFGLIYSKV